MSRSRALLQTLVGFDTTSRESNLQLIAFVRDYLASHGVASELIYNEARTKANLFASVGPVEVPGYCAVRAYRCRAGGWAAVERAAV